MWLYLLYIIVSVVCVRTNTASLHVVGAISCVVPSKNYVPFMTTSAMAVSSNCQSSFCQNLQLVSTEDLTSIRVHSPFEYFSQCFLLGRPVYLHRARTLQFGGLAYFS